jgi:pimeloyl-ACP methyl ester carboxylesterase
VPLWATDVGHGPPLIVCHGGPGLWDMFASRSAWATAVAGSAKSADQHREFTILGLGAGPSLHLRQPRPVMSQACGEVAPVVGRGLPSATRVAIRDAGHVPWLEAPDEFGSAPRTFLS